MVPYRPPRRTRRHVQTSTEDGVLDTVKIFTPSAPTSSLKDDPPITAMESVTSYSWLLSPTLQLLYQVSSVRCLASLRESMSNPHA